MRKRFEVMTEAAAAAAARRWLSAILLVGRIGDPCERRERDDVLQAAFTLHACRELVASSRIKRPSFQSRGPIPPR